MDRAAVKYGRAVAHVAVLYQHLSAAGSGREREVDLAVDETDTPTTYGDRFFIATELRQLGVRWVSLAPRIVGRFEKGVEYIGDVGALAADLAVHSAITRTFGPYKISLHSGSDKLSIYGACAAQTRGLVQLKTAGNSYLEALRSIVVFDPYLLRSIYRFSCDRYKTDRASYHVSAKLDRAQSQSRRLTPTCRHCSINSMHGRSCTSRLDQCSHRGTMRGSGASTMP